MPFSWTLDGLKDRLKEHGEFIDSVISLIPPKYYFKSNPNTAEEENNFQPNKRKRLPKQVINEQKKQAKRRKLDPNNLKTVKDIQKEILNKIKQEKEKEQNEKKNDEEVKVDNNDNKVDNEEDNDENQEVENNVNEEEGEKNEKSNDELDENDKEEDKTKIDPPFKSMKKESRKQLSISDRLANFSEKEKRKNLSEAKKEETKLKRKHSKTNEDSEKDVKKGDTKENGDIKKKGETKKIDNFKKNGGIKRKISEEEDSWQKNDDLQFAKFDFVDGKKRKKKINDVHLINKLQKKVEKEEELKKKDPKKALELHEKEAWSKVFKKAQGEKVKDDPRLLKKTIKKKVISKKKSEKAWKNRIKSVEKSMADRQQKRSENIQARIASKKQKKNKRNK